MSSLLFSVFKFCLIMEENICKLYIQTTITIQNIWRTFKAKGLLEKKIPLENGQKTWKGVSPRGYKEANNHMKRCSISWVTGETQA